MVQGVLNGFNGAQITNYSSAIKGLNLNQAQLLLTTQGLNAERSREILIEAGLLASENAIQAELLESTLIKAGFGKEEREEILRKLNLIAIQGEEAVVQGTCTAEDLRATLAQRLKNEADVEGIMATLGLAGANKTATVSVGLLTKSIWANIKAMAAWMVSNPIGWIIMAGVAIVGTTKAIISHNEALEESRQEMIETGKEAAQLTKDLDGLVAQYRKLGEDGTFDNSDREQARNIQQQINELLGDEVRYVDLANGSYETQLKLLQRLQYEQARQNHADIENAKVAAEDSLLNKIKVKILDINGGAFTTQGEMDAYDEFLKSKGFSKYVKEDDVGDKVFRAEINSAEDAIAVYDDLVKIKTILSTEYEKEIQKGGELYDFYNEVNAKIGDMSEAVQKYKDAISNYNINEAVMQFNKTEFAGVKGALIDSKEELVSWMNAMLESDDISDGIAANLIGLANTYYPQYADAINETVQAHLKEKATALTLESVQDGEISKLYELGKQYGLTEKEIIDLIATQTIFNNTNLSVAGKISALAELETQLGITTSKAIGLNSALAGISSDSRSSLLVAHEYGVKKNAKGEWTYKGKSYASLTPALNLAMYDELMSSTKDLFGENPPPDTSPDDDDKDNKPDYEDLYDEFLETLEQEVENLDESIERINTKLEHAIKTGNAEQIQILSKELDDAYKQKKALLESKANEARTQLALIMEEIYAIAPQLTGKSINEITPYEIEAISMSLGDASDKWDSITKSAQNYYETISEWSDEWWANEEDKLSNTEEYYNTILSEIDRYVEHIEKAREEEIETLDKQITKEEALLKIKQGQYDATNNLKEAQKDIDKEIANSRNSKEYLSDYEYERIFGEADYEYLSGEIRKIGSEINGISANFYQQIEDAYKNDQLYLVEAITAEYERQVAMKERELEIAQAKVDLEKKRLTFENAKAERNIKQYSENGVTWVADQEKVKQAQEDLIDAQAEIKDLQRKSAQQIELDRRQANIDMLNSQKESFDYQLELLNKSTEKLKESIENVTDPLADLGVILQTLVNDTNTSISNSAQEVASGIGSVSSGSFGSGYSTGEYVPTAKTTNYDGTQNYTDASNIISINGQLFDKSQTDSNGLAKPIENATMVGGFDPKKVYDSGGIASGKGIMLKAVDEEETVLPPWLTKEVLTPEYNENFDKLLKNMQLVNQFNPSDFIVKPQIPSLINNMAAQPSVTNHWSGDMHVDGGDPNEILRVLQKVFNKVKLQ